MQGEEKNMQDKTESKSYTIGMDMATGKDMTVYACSICRMVIARTEVPMEDEGIRSKLSRHKCASPGKSDFEQELR